MLLISKINLSLSLDPGRGGAFSSNLAIGYMGVSSEREKADSMHDTMCGFDESELSPLIPPRSNALSRSIASFL